MSERLSFSVPRTRVEEGSDGRLLLRSAEPLGEHAVSVIHEFRAGSEAHPDRLLVVERDSNREWIRTTWGEAREQADRLAQGLLNRGLADRPLLLLSGNSRLHLVVMLAAMTVGTPVVPLSVAYSLQSGDHERLRWAADLVDAGLVFAENASFTTAVAAVAADRAVLSADANLAGAMTPAELGAEPTLEIAERSAALARDTVAKIMFTSGSTSRPKGVITTHGMLSANQQQLRQVWPFLAQEPPVLLDWLPWSHTFGGSHNLNLILTNGGTLWIDDGRPVPELIDRTVRNLSDAQPTMYFGVPAAYNELIPYLEHDAQAADAFLARLQLGFFAAAALPQNLWDRLEGLAADHGSPMQMAIGWGLTETSPAATEAHSPITRSDALGVPLPGVTVSLVPIQDALEIRVRGPNVTPGYYQRPDLTAEAFDQDGFLRTGDAATLADPENPAAGLVFDGRITENFKLATGTFVRVGTLRPKLLSVSNGLLSDAIICGENHAYITAMVWLTAAHAHRLNGEGVPEPSLREELNATLKRLATDSASSSQRIERLLVLTEPPQLDAGELTDKGYINQRVTRKRRSASANLLTGDPPPPRVICRT